MQIQIHKRLTHPLGDIFSLKQQLNWWLITQQQEGRQTRLTNMRLWKCLNLQTLKLRDKPEYATSTQTVAEEAVKSVVTMASAYRPESHTSSKAFSLPNAPN